MVIFLIEKSKAKMAIKIPKSIKTVFGVIILKSELKYNKPKIPKITVNTIWMPLQIKFRKTTFLVSFFLKNKAFPAYSPTPFGVNNPAVKAAKTC